MKPLYLSIQAFGPFADTQIIEFSKLGENPLFLINGPTGAGKSTVLDAISFALYGESTGKERDPSSMRCDLASDDLNTEIIFDFILGDKVYRIIRSPAQEVSKKRGEGTTTKAPTALVYQQENNGEAVCVDVESEQCQLLKLKGVKEVNEWVKTITGLSSEQFRQVMVLPQGQFRKLLLAESKDREEIFSQLFQTQIYKQIEDRLKDQSAQLRRDRNKLKENIVGVLSVINLEKSSDLELVINDVNPEYIKVKQRLSELNNEKDKSIKAIQAAQQVSKQYVLLKQNQQSLQNLEQQTKQIDEYKQRVLIFNKAKKLTPAFDAMQQTKQKIETQEKTQAKLEIESKTLKQDKILLDQHLAQAIEQFNTSDELKKQLNEWQQKQQALLELTKLRVGIQEINQQVMQLKTHAKTIEDQKKQNQQMFEALTKDIKQQQLDIQQLPGLQAQLENYFRLGTVKRDVVKNETDLSVLQNNQQLAEQKWQQTQLQVEQAHKSLQQCELSWHQGQAFELAKQLNENEACLVCGSFDHPNLASAKDVQYSTKSDVDHARVQLNEANQKLSQQQNIINLNNEKIKHHQQQIVSLNEQLGELHIEPIEWFEMQWKQTNQNVKKIKLINQALVDNESKRNNIEQKLNEIEKQKIDNNESTQQQLMKHSGVKAQIDSIEKTIEIEFQDAEKIQLKIESLSKTIFSIEQQYKKSNEDCQVHNQLIAANTSLLNASIQTLNDMQQQMVLDTQNWQSMLDESDFLNVQQYKNAIIDETQLSSLMHEIEKYDAARTEYKIRIDQLTTDLNGKEESDLTQLNNQLEQLTQTINQQTQIFNQLNSRLQSLNDAQKQLKLIDQALNKIDEKYKVVGTMSDVASGTINKVSLQRYVLSVLLDDVLYEASQRLQLMSKGRFILRRKLDKTKGNKSSGLDLEIEDAYSNLRRPANTLSGGESFMAALSLALGLSDVVQSYSGGVKLETLFIDEGFGSLDMESLDLAIQTLIELRKSGRTIGIISHVSELKEQMNQRIDVIASNSGSQIRLVT